MKVLLSVPKVRLSIGGSELEARDARRLEDVLIRRRLSQPTLCELTFRDPGGGPSPMDLGVPGMALSVEAEGFSQTLFKGEITAVEYVYEPDAGRIVRVRGYDLLHRLRKRQPVRIHLDVQVPDLATEMVGELGFSVEASEPGPVFRRVIQYWQSDLDFLVELARRAGLYLSVEGTVLHLVTTEGNGAGVELKLGNSLLEARVEMNAETACRNVHADGWDPSVAEWSRGSASRARSGRSIGAGLEPADTGGTGEVVLEGLTTDMSLLESHAQSELDRRVAGEVILWGVAQGNPEILPGRPVLVDGLADSLCGTYVVTEVSHTINRTSGFVSEFSTAPPQPMPTSQPYSLLVGVITSIDDPDALGRVRAKLPTMGDLETEWMCVLAPGGGNNKGLVAIPELGDQVLIAPAPGDPALGVVLGGISGSKGLPDTGIEDGRIMRYSFQTPGGQRVRLDDKGKQIRIDNSDGSYIDLTPQQVMLHSNTNLTIEAPGRNIVIQAQKIDFRRI